MNLFTFTGWSGSGKTTLISKLIRELSHRGWEVMAIKKVPDKFNLEPEGKDSRIFLEHGAQIVYLVAGKQLMKMSSIKKPEEIFETENKVMDKHDFVLIEGEISSDSFMFEIFDPEISETQKTENHLLSAIISDISISDKLKHFKRNDIVEIADFMESLNKSKGRK